MTSFVVLFLSFRVLARSPLSQTTLDIVDLFALLFVVVVNVCLFVFLVPFILPVGSESQSQASLSARRVSLPRRRLVHEARALLRASGLPGRGRPLLPARSVLRGSVRPDVPERSSCS